MPLVQLTEFSYQFFSELTHNPALSILGLSLVVSLSTLPLYIIAEKWQEIERNVQKTLSPTVKRIKETFSGDEQYMMLNAFYSEQRYHPIMSLRSSFSLLIQIPFFIAAYNFLNDLEPLKDFSIFGIKSFGMPDGLLVFKNNVREITLRLNILPVIMTAINITAGAIYSRGHEIKEKVQIYLCALIFLVLLYNSPSGLVFYWTMNNIFSLIKNVFYKLKHPKKVLYILSLFLSLTLILASIFSPLMKPAFKMTLTALAIALPFLPIVSKLVSNFLEKHLSQLDNNAKIRFSLFFISSLSLSLLTGLLIPSILIKSETSQYCFVDGYRSPMVFIETVFSEALGFFLLWPVAFYALFSKKTKKAFAILFPCFLVYSLINTFFFSGKYGPINSNLIFMYPENFHVGLESFLLNIALFFGSVWAILLLIKKRPVIIKSVLSITLLAVSLTSIINSLIIGKTYLSMTPPLIEKKIKPIFHLAKKEVGRNVIVIMQDRLFSPFIPVFFSENPSDKEKFQGFTFYRNCVSFGLYTMIGVPGIFGGYSYTPFEINKDTTKTLREKHNEAILSMPISFHNASFNVSVSDLPYENYLREPIESMYQDYPFINRCETHGVYSDLWYARHKMKKAPFTSSEIKRNFIWFSFFKIAPPILRQAVYHGEYWLAYNKYDNISKFIDNYSEIEFFPELFDTSSEKDNFFLLDNEATHEPALLQFPDYVPQEKITDIGTGEFRTNTQYHTVAGVLKRLEDFFQFLRDNDAYDNTRIIIVSDHGTFIEKSSFENTEGLLINKDVFTASLMVKDFNEKGDLKVDDTFMTNADTPGLATKDIIENATNPFTHLPFHLRENEKTKYVKIMFAPAESTRIRDRTQFTVEDNEWYGVKDNIFKKENWFRYDTEFIKKELGKE